MSEIKENNETVEIADELVDKELSPDPVTDPEILADLEGEYEFNESNKQS